MLFYVFEIWMPEILFLLGFWWKTDHSYKTSFSSLHVVWTRVFVALVLGLISNTWFSLFVHMLHGVQNDFVILTFQLEWLVTNWLHQSSTSIHFSCILKKKEQFWGEHPIAESCFSHEICCSGFPPCTLYFSEFSF